MPKIMQIIKANPTEVRRVPDGEPSLMVAEFFYNTIQGEGVYTGHPAAFLRMQHCTMNCFWCDTASVWRQGNPYTLDELFDLMDKSNDGTKDVVSCLAEGQHLVLTGGSPLLQQDMLLQFIRAFGERYQFYPFIEIENECTIKPNPELIPYISCWNNSPKLSNSGNVRQLRYQPEILKKLSSFKNSWFKFVVRDEADWNEIQTAYLDPLLIKREQIILMPRGGSRAELEQNRPNVVEMAVKYNVRYSTREHVVLWDKMTGV